MRRWEKDIKYKTEAAFYSNEPKYYGGRNNSETVPLQDVIKLGSRLAEIP